MNKKIHQILQESGIEKGPSSEDALLILLLGNPEIFSAFSQNLKSQLSEKEYEETMAFFRLQQKKFQESQEQHAADLLRIQDEQEESYFQQNPLSSEDILALKKECPFLFSSP